MSFPACQKQGSRSILKKEGCVSGEKQDVMDICSPKASQVEYLSLPTLMTVQTVAFLFWTSLTSFLRDVSALKESSPKKGQCKTIPDF